MENSPLLLCDTCPRSFQACLGLSTAELPSGDWCCPKCTAATQAALRRVMGQDARRAAAGERAAIREKVWVRPALGGVQQLAGTLRVCVPDAGSGGGTRSRCRAFSMC